MPTATAHCSCGKFQDTATGPGQVRRLVAAWTAHRETCPRVPAETAALAARRRAEGEQAEQWARKRKAA